MPNIAKKIYPVGSIYMSVNSANPSTLFGGTWVAWGSGRVPIGVNTADNDFNAPDKTGGSKTHKHKSPFATSGNSGNTDILPWNNSFGDGYESFESANYNNLNNSPVPSPKTMYRHYTSTNMDIPMPYITCYMQKRTA